jgi:hypothetical protein
MLLVDVVLQPVARRLAMSKLSMRRMCGTQSDDRGLCSDFVPKVSSRVLYLRKLETPRYNQGVKFEWIALPENGEGTRIFFASLDEMRALCVIHDYEPHFVN